MTQRKLDIFEVCTGVISNMISKERRKDTKKMAKV
jgi:hypothetical protein